MREGRPGTGGIRALVTALAIGVAAAGVGIAGQARAQDAEAACSPAKIQAMAPSGVVIVSAERLAAPVSHCKVDGYITTTNPGPNRVNFRMQLPDKALWQGRYYFIGMGGSAGYVPTDSQIPAGNPLIGGFAVAGTDTGHTAHMLDWGFLSNPAQAIDHIHRGAHVTAVATQQITKSYYGASKLWRYHMGCSGGGRMGSELIQRYPTDFDGVMIGGNSSSAITRPEDPPWAGFHIMVREMTREPGSWLSPVKLKLAETKVTAACDMTDGAADGVIWDHKLCKYDFKQLKCAAGDQPDCLTQPEITSIENLLRDTRMPISNMANWTFLGPVPPPWSPEPSVANMPKTSGALVILTTWARTYLGQPDRDIVKNPLTAAELRQMKEAQNRIGFNSPVNPDLKGIEKAGTKIFFWNGVSDPCCSNITLQEYWQDLVKSRGGDNGKVMAFARYYEVPGMPHCGGGNGPSDAPDQLIRAMIDWVEKGKAPEGVVAHRGDRAKLLFANADGSVSGVIVPPAAGSARDFLLCPYPMVSVFDASKAGAPGAVDDAANWSCRRSRS